MLASVSCTSTSSAAEAVDRLTTALSTTTLSTSASQTGAVNRRDFTVMIPLRPTQLLPEHPASHAAAAQIMVCVCVDLCASQLHTVSDWILHSLLT